ncbi:MAG: nickel insertion protein [Eggerthellaceae bacterium]
MDGLHFDFRESATRASIISQLERHLEACGIDDDSEERVARAGVPARHHHDYREVLATIDALEGVSEAVRSDMRGIYGILSRAEAQAHGVEPGQEHFHEVGNAAGIEGVLRVCLMVEAARVGRITATPVQVGSGTVRCAHGELPIPAPATAAILAQGIPVHPVRLDGELCTPSSAAMILHFVDEFGEGAICG